jgi:SHS2 domain-containing protein
MYRFIDHTADIAFEVEAESLGELIEGASKAFYEAFVFVDKLEVSEEVAIEVEADGEDYLLYRWLNELLYLFDTQHFAGKEISVNVEGEAGEALKARGVVWGGKLRDDLVRCEPKAITLHKFTVERKDGGWRAFVVVDI